MSNEAQGQQDYNSGSTDFNIQNFIIDQLINKIQTITLVKVIAVTNNDTISPVGFVNVQPMVNQMTGKRESVEHGVIYSIPYFRLQGGINAIIIDPEPGDIGMCGFCSRDISVVKNTKKIANPGSYRKYAWADGLYLGGFLNGVPTNYVAINSNGITLTSPTKVTINAPTTDINANVNIIGNTVFTGTVTANDHVIDERHTHTGVTTGPSITGQVSA